MPTDPPRTYKHQLSEAEFVFAFTATAEEFAERADEMRGKGVERVTHQELEEQYGINTGFYPDNQWFTYVSEAEIKANGANLELTDLTEPVPGLVLHRCLIPSLDLKNCALAGRADEPAQQSTTSFILNETTTGNFGISDSSTTGNFRISDSSTTGDFWIWGSSTTGDFGIEEKSTIGNFRIEEKSTIGNFRIEEKSTTGNFRIEEKSTTGNFWIYGSSTTGNFSISSSSTTGNFRIEKNSTTGSFGIEKNSTTGNFWIYGSSMTGNFWISGSSTTSDFSIEDSSTTGNFWIYGSSTTGNFRISSSCRTGYFSIEGKSTTGSFSIWGSSTTGEFRIEQKSTTGDFMIDNSQCNSFSGVDLFCSFSFIGATVPQLRLTNCHIPKLDIGSGCKIEAYLADSTINLIDLRHLTLSKESVVSLFNCKVYACLMEEFAVLGQLYLRQLKRLAQPFTWYDPTTRAGENPNPKTIKQLEAQAEYYKIEVQQLTGEGDKELAIKTSTFRIAQSSLSKTEFTNCELGGFRFEFSNAKITEVFMSGGTVPLENIVIYGEKPNTLPWEEQKVSVYNQLKKIFEGQGDVYWSTYFQAKTAEHQEKLLRLRRKREKALFNTTFWDLRTFQLNRWSNLHGESWGRALAFTLVTPIPIYLFFLLVGCRLFLPPVFAWKFFWIFIDWNFLGYYFNFLDPIHRINFLEDMGVKLTGWSYIADFFGRIVVGYGIYQFIAAFRKHGKK